MVRTVLMLVSMSLPLMRIPSDVVRPKRTKDCAFRCVDGGDGSLCSGCHRLSAMQESFTRRNLQFSAINSKADRDTRLRPFDECSAGVALIDLLGWDHHVTTRPMGGKADTNELPRPQRQQQQRQQQEQRRTATTTTATRRTSTDGPGSRIKKENGMSLWRCRQVVALSALLSCIATVLWLSSSSPLSSWLSLSVLRQSVPTAPFPMLRWKQRQEENELNDEGATAAAAAASSTRTAPMTNISLKSEVRPCRSVCACPCMYVCMHPCECRGLYTRKVSMSFRTGVFICPSLLTGINLPYLQHLQQRWPW